MSSTLLLSLVVGLGVLMIFVGLARTPSRNTAEMVQQRLTAYGGGGVGDRPLTLEEVELQRPFSERFLRPAIERLGWRPAIPVEQRVVEYLEWMAGFTDTADYLAEADRVMREQQVIRSVTRT